MSKKIHVRAARDGFRRAGRVFNKEGVVIDTATLTKDELAAIEGDPSLTVRAVVEETKETPAERKAREKAEAEAAAEAKRLADAAAAGGAGGQGDGK